MAKRNIFCPASTYANGMTGPDMDACRRFTGEAGKEDAESMKTIQYRHIRSVCIES